MPTAPPESFEGNAVDATSVSLTWKEIPSSKRNGVITGYKVQFWPIGDTKTWTNLDVAGNKLAVTIQDLQVNYLYEFIVAGLTKDGIGPYSNKIVIKLNAPKGKVY